MEDGSIFRKQNSRKDNQEKLLYACRSQMKEDPLWDVMNKNGKCNDYLLLIENIKIMKKYASENVNSFTLNCCLWKPCLNTLKRVFKMYGFYIDDKSFRSDSSKCLILRKEL